MTNFPPHAGALLPQASSLGAGGTALLSVAAVIGIALIAFCVAALVSISRAPGLSSNARLGWLAAVVVFQFFGPIAWFGFGRKEGLR